MNEQLIAQLQLLIELAKTGEEFKIDGFSGKFRFSDIKSAVLRLEDYPNSNWEEVYVMFDDILNKEIIRKPWKPKEGEPYWYWYPYGGKIEDIAPYKVDSFWSKSMHDLPNYMIGNCFRTKEECESHTEIRDKLIAMRKEYE